MRFPKISQIFHRRSKSDSALSQHLGPVIDIIPQPRPISASFLDGLVFPHDTDSSLCSEILTAIPIRPLSVTIPRVSSSAVSSRNTVHSANSSISAASHSIVVEVLTRRIQDLEASLQSHEGEPCPGVSLEAELEHSREVLLQAQPTNHSLTSKVAELETRLKQTQEELSEALRQTVSPQSDELEALRAENKRLTNLLRVFVPSNATCSVLDCAAARVKAGEDSE